MTHDKFCPLDTAPCCPHIPNCTCQCLCDWVKEIRDDEAWQAKQRVWEASIDFSKAYGTQQFGGQDMMPVNDAMFAAKTRGGEQA